MGPLPLDVPAIPTDGTLVSGTLTATDRADYYALHAEAGGSFRILLDGLPPGAGGGFFVMYEGMPTPLNYDRSSSLDVQGRPQLAFTTLLGGTYYILVRADDLIAQATYSLTGAETDLVVSEISPDRHGVDRTCTMTISGAGFTPDTAVEFIASNGSVRTPAVLQVLSAETMVVALDTPTWPQDVYDVVISKPGASRWQAADGFTVNSGAANLEAHLIIPGNMDRLWRRRIWIEYANTGDSSMGAPLLTLHGDDNAMLTLDPSVAATLTDTFPPGISDTVQVMARGCGATPGILQPGDTGRIPVYFIGLRLPWIMFDGTIDFDLDYLSAAETAVIDWPALKEDMQPAWIQDDGWDAVWLNFTDHVGDTWGDYVAMLDENMSYLDQVGDVPRSITEMVAFEYRRADGLSPIRYLAASVDGSVPTPGLSLDFVRAYAQPISRRYAVGPLGRGWTHSWQISLEEAADGTVRIYDMTGTPKLFLADGSGGYTGQPADNGTLTRLDAAGFELRERSGLLTAFYADGRLRYVQDTNANRITAGYGGALLTSLTHSNGGRLLLEYYPNGRLWRLTDPLDPGDPAADRVTTYGYDASGEYLVTVTAPGNRVTTYAYEMGGTPQQRHALLSVEHPDGTREYFVYDLPGRLTETYLDGGAEAVMYTYDSAGTVTVEDATGRQTALGFGPGGQVAQVRDGEGNVIGLRYDDRYQLRQITSGGGETYVYTYDNRGNVTAVEDPLRRDTGFTYTTTLDDLSSVTDARGNGMDYEYDAAGNLVAIIYDDATRETFTYDSPGNVLSWTNRRGQTVRYTRDAAGQIASKDYPDTPEIDYLYTYDAAGDLLSATGPDGTTLMTYDADTGWLARIEYPGGRWFEFDYDNAGRRTCRTDQAGNEVNYLCDLLGRLDNMRDGAGALIVDYDYDPAGRLDRKTLGNGVYTTYAYDAAGRLTALDNLAPGGSQISFFHYTYDASGRRTSMETAEGTWQYGYDPLGQLTSVTYPDGHVVEYVYDAAGNRLQVIDDGMPTAYVTNSMNQYEQVGAVTYGYDADGNLVSKTEGGVTTTYIYNVEDRLVQASTPTDTWIYTYDALGKRMASAHNGVTITYVVDPIGLGNVAAEYDAGGSLVARYDHGYGLLARSDVIGKPAYYTFDAVGSTSELTDETGVAANQYEYDAFGNLLGRSEAIGNPFQYVGEYGVMHETTGLEFMRARYFDPQTGRFVSPDPVGISGGSANLYGYVNNDPISETDPRGLLSYRGIQCAVNAPVTLAGIWGGRLGEYVNPWSMLIGHGQYWGAMRDATKDGSTAPPKGNPYQAIAWQHDWDLKNSGSEFWDIGNPDVQAAHLKLWHGFNRAVLNELKRFCGWTEDPVPAPDNPPRADDADDDQGTVPREIPRPRDPNDKLGPAGFGEANYVAPKDLWEYKIRFENVSSATAPAHKIIIIDVLDEDLDLGTFELTEIGFANNTIMVPKGLGNYRAAMGLIVDNEYVAQTTLRVQIDVSLDKATRTLTCTVMGLDMQTGWLPEDIMLGILYPNDDTDRGDGYLSYVVKPKTGLASGTEITNQASIVFDWNDPSDTPLVWIAIDAETPVSQVRPLAETTHATEFTVSIAASDEANGSGVAGVDVYVADVPAEGEPSYELWLDDFTGGLAEFIGQNRHTYAFYSLATDNVGHVEEMPAGGGGFIEPDAVTTLQDDVPPYAAQISVERGPLPCQLAAISVRFSETVTISDPCLVLEDAVSGRTIVLPAETFSYDPTTRIARWDAAGRGIEGGRYTVTLAAEGLVDRAANAMDGDGDGVGGDSMEFLALMPYRGDANEDGDVGRDDLLAMKASFGKADITWAGGDFDGDHDVDVLDYITLKANYGRSIGGPPEQPIVPAGAPKAPTTPALAPEPIVPRSSGDASAPAAGAASTQEQAEGIVEAPAALTPSPGANGEAADAAGPDTSVGPPLFLEHSVEELAVSATSDPSDPFARVDALGQANVGPLLPPGLPLPAGLPRRRSFVEPLTVSRVRATAMARQVGALPSVRQRPALSPIRLNDPADIPTSPQPARRPSLSSTDLLEVLRPVRLPLGGLRRSHGPPSAK